MTKQHAIWQIKKRFTENSKNDLQNKKLLTNYLFGFFWFFQRTAAISLSAAPSAGLGSKEFFEEVLQRMAPFAEAKRGWKQEVRWVALVCWFVLKKGVYLWGYCGSLEGVKNVHVSFCLCMFNGTCTLTYKCESAKAPSTCDITCYFPITFMWCFECFWKRFPEMFNLGTVERPFLKLFVFQHCKDQHAQWELCQENWESLCCLGLTAKWAPKNGGGMGCRGLGNKSSSRFEKST